MMFNFRKKDGCPRKITSRAGWRRREDGKRPSSHRNRCEEIQYSTDIYFSREDFWWAYEQSCLMFQEQQHQLVREIWWRLARCLLDDMRHRMPMSVNLMFHTQPVDFELTKNQKTHVRWASRERITSKHFLGFPIILEEISSQEIDDQQLVAVVKLSRAVNE